MSTRSNTRIFWFNFYMILTLLGGFIGLLLAAGVTMLAGVSFKHDCRNRSCAFLPIALFSLAVSASNGMIFGVLPIKPLS